MAWRHISDVLWTVPTRQLANVNKHCVRRAATTSRDMAKAVVLLFLLDYLPDFHNVMNSTLHKVAPGSAGVTCSPAITAPILQVIGKKLNLTPDSVEHLQTDQLIHRPYRSHKVEELSPESFNNMAFCDNSMEISYEYSLEKHIPEFIEHNYIGNRTAAEDIDVHAAGVNNTIGNVKASLPGKKLNRTEDIKAPLEMSNRTRNANVRFPERAPFLVALFETVGNVTAQTCGGVVVASRWVLTAASCVNVLGTFYINSSNETTENYYSVVIGAENPLKDGSVHQVSKIYLHPTPYETSFASHPNVRHGPTNKWFNSVLGSKANATAPSLALLRIDPGVGQVTLPAMQQRTDWDGVTGRMYGWILEQKATSFVMKAFSAATKQLSAAECKTAHGIVGNDYTLCLSVDYRSYPNATRMVSGCPVVVVQGGRLELQAVALADGSEPLLAGSLIRHRDWLRKIALSDK